MAKILSLAEALARFNDDIEISPYLDHRIFLGLTIQQVQRLGAFELYRVAAIKNPTAHERLTAGIVNLQAFSNELQGLNDEAIPHYSITSQATCDRVYITRQSRGNRCHQPAKGLPLTSNSNCRQAAWFGVHPHILLTASSNVTRDKNATILCSVALSLQLREVV